MEPHDRSRHSGWLQKQLFERRIVLVTGRLDDAAANEAAAALMTLDATGEEPIELHLDSPGGTLEAAFVLIDMLGGPSRDGTRLLPRSGRRSHDRCPGGGPSPLSRAAHTLSTRAAEDTVLRDA